MTKTTKAVNLDKGLIESVLMFAPAVTKNAVGKIIAKTEINNNPPAVFEKQMERIENKKCTEINTLAFFLSSLLFLYLFHTCAAFFPNFCSLCEIPPKKKHIPRTNNIFDKIEPNNDVWTNLVSPATKATIERINSTILKESQNGKQT